MKNLLFLLILFSFPLFSQTTFYGGVNYMTNAGYGMEIGGYGEKYGMYLNTTLFPYSTPLVDAGSGGSEYSGERWNSSTCKEVYQVSFGFLQKLKYNFSYLLGAGFAVKNDVTMTSRKTYYYHYDLGTSSYNDTKYVPLLEAKIRYSISGFYVQMGASTQGFQIGIGLFLQI
jgi:hypothetical protein